MKYISQLPEPYKSLAEKNMSNDFNPNSLSAAFVWDTSEEGRSFWNAVYEAKDESELPFIPDGRMNEGKLIIKKDEVWYEYLFPVFAEHGLTLTQTEIADIIYEVHKVTEKA